MQLTGSQLTNASALLGNDVATFPDYPAEIRAPKGTRGGVSGFQVQFASEDIFTPGRPSGRAGRDESGGPGDEHRRLGAGRDPDRQRGRLHAQGPASWPIAARNPLEDGSLSSFRVIKVPMTTLTRKAVEELGLGQKFADRCKNFFATGLIFWLYGRPLDPTLRFIQEKFGNKPDIAPGQRAGLARGLVLRRDDRSVRRSATRSSRRSWSRGCTRT